MLLCIGHASSVGGSPFHHLLLLAQKLCSQCLMSAALQQENRLIANEAQSAKVDDAEVQQLSDRLKQAEAANLELQNTVAIQVIKRMLVCGSK